MAFRFFPDEASRENTEWKIGGVDVFSLFLIDLAPYFPAFVREDMGPSTSISGYFRTGPGHGRMSLLDNTGFRGMPPVFLLGRRAQPACLRAGAENTRHSLRSHAHVLACGGTAGTPVRRRLSLSPFFARLLNCAKPSRPSRRNVDKVQTLFFRQLYSLPHGKKTRPLIRRFFPLSPDI